MAKDDPVAFLHECEGERELTLYNHGAGALTKADKRAGWTETPLYALAPASALTDAQATIAALRAEVAGLHIGLRDALHALALIERRDGLIDDEMELRAKAHAALAPKRVREADEQQEDA